MPDFRVALLGLPFSGVTEPSIQLGLLKALAERSGVPTDTYHLYLDLAAQLPDDVMRFFCTRHARMTGEWLFATAAFGESALRDEEYFDRFPEEFEIPGKYNKDFRYFSELRQHILPAFINH